MITRLYPTLLSRKIYDLSYHYNTVALSSRNAALKKKERATRNDPQEMKIKETAKLNQL